MMLERQREGIAKAKAEGKYKGRKPLSDEIVDKIKAMHANQRRPHLGVSGIGYAITSHLALERLLVGPDLFISSLFKPAILLAFCSEIPARVAVPAPLVGLLRAFNL